MIAAVNKQSNDPFMLSVDSAFPETSVAQSRWLMMWGLAIVIFFFCKWLTWWRTPHVQVPVRRQLGYVFAWPGMDAVAFFNAKLHPAKPAWSEWLFAMAKMASGVAMLFVVARRVHLTDAYWLGWIGMVGIAMCLHFGLFHLLSCAWRRAGVEARPLMNWPLASVRISDYWGRRWNTAFRDLTHRFLFRPLTRRLGTRAALLAGFLLSGLVHDAVISIPAGGGYGGPTLFFLLQPVGMLAERSRLGRRLGVGTGVRGWLFTMAFLLLPARQLFHTPFVTRVIVPFMHAIGAI
jgi:hypothetical protein